MRPSQKKAGVKKDGWPQCFSCCGQGDAEVAYAEAASFETHEPLHVREAAPPQQPNRQMCRNICLGCCGIFCVGILVLGVWIARCVASVKSQTAITKPLVKDMNGGQYFTLKNMSVIPTNLWEQYESAFMSTWETEQGFEFGYAAPEIAPRLLYNASKVPSIFEQVPEKLRGVYWMRGNPIPEILAVVQYGKWFEKEKTLLLPNTPWTWGWWGGTTSQYPKDLDRMSKWVYSFASGREIAESYTAESALHTLVSFKFGKCPKDAECKEGADDFAYADLMSHPDGDLSRHGMVYYDGYTMEEMDAKEVADKDQKPGAMYFRRASMFCGLFGDDTGYKLTKILDANGNPVQPYYDEYVLFMSERPIIIWSNMPKSLLKGVPGTTTQAPDPTKAEG